ncbi:MAG: hypothetical protein JWM10_2274 [Myxococcaceae bacterium]|nr:hypothetical protein [Myxococcaceae bacterium]
MTVEEIAEAVAALSLDEARALVAALQARLALEDPMPDWRNMVVLYGAPPTPENRTAYLPHALVLLAVGPKRALVISALRVAFSISMAEAKAAADAAPCSLGTMPDEFAANAVADALRAVGATIELRPVTP